MLLLIKTAPNHGATTTMLDSWHASPSHLQTYLLSLLRNSSNFPPEGIWLFYVDSCKFQSNLKVLVLVQELVSWSADIQLASLWTVTLVFSSSWQDSSLVIPGLIFNILTNFLPSEGDSLRKYGKRTNVVTNLNNLDLCILLFELMIMESALNLQFSFLNLHGVHLLSKL